MNVPCLFLRRLGVDDLAHPLRRSMRQIAEAVARQHGLTLADLTGKSRVRKIILPRHEAMALIRFNTRHSLPQIGRFFGGRDHTTVLSGVRAHAMRVSGQ